MTARAKAAAPARARHARTKPDGPRHREGDSVLRRLVSGDRPYVLAFFVLLVVLAMMIVGPLQSYTSAAERVHDLQVTQIELARTVADLQARQDRLQDPEQIELLARQRLGLVKPGEIPFVVVGPPEDDAVQQVRPEPAEAAPADDAPWYRRLGRVLSNLLDGEG